MHLNHFKATYIIFPNKKLFKGLITNWRWKFLVPPSVCLYVSVKVCVKGLMGLRLVLR